MSHKSDISVRHDFRGHRQLAGKLGETFLPAFRLPCIAVMLEACLFDWQILKPFHRKLDRIMDQFADEQIDAVLLDAFQRQIETFVQIAGEENPLSVRAFEQERKRNWRAVGQPRHVVVAVCRHLDVAVVEDLPFLEDLEW